MACYNSYDIITVRDIPEYESYITMLLQFSAEEGLETGA